MLYFSCRPFVDDCFGGILSGLSVLEKKKTIIVFQKCLTVFQKYYPSTNNDNDNDNENE